MNTYEILREVIARDTQQVFYIQFGLTQKHVNQLIMFTQAETDEIKLDGDEKRFMSLEQYAVWRQKGRAIYTLIDSIEEGGNLCGIFWAGQKDLPQRSDYTENLDREFYRHTYAFRLYGSARGHGLSHLVLSVCMNDYVGRLNLPIGAWLEVSGLNASALRMDQKMGYRVVSGLNNRGRLVLAREYLQ